MARKVIIDCDPGIDDAIALCLALFEPRLDVFAVTAVEGNVPADIASINVQTVIDQLDPPRLPRLGAATAPEVVPDTDRRHMHGEDGLGNVNFNVSQLHHQHSSEKLICDRVRSYPDEVSIICLGPLTNVARAFQRDPDIVPMVDQVIISGGAINGIGDITPAAEANIFFDPISARTVLRSATTKTLIPLDVSLRLPFTLDIVEQLPPETTRAGRFLRRIVPFSFRAYRQFLGLENVFWSDVVALVAAIHPELFETREMAGDVETIGELTRGATVFDRRRRSEWRANMAVATEIDTAAVLDCILRGFNDAGRQT